MKRSNILWGGETYSAPELEVISATVEHGFEGSYGDPGEAGGDYDINDGGDF